MAGFKEFPPDFEELYDVQMYIGISSTPTKAHKYVIMNILKHTYTYNMV